MKVPRYSKEELRKKRPSVSSELKPLLNCPFCGSPAELKTGELKPTLEEAMIAEKNARCSAHYCPARFIVCTISEWNTRAI